MDETRGTDTALAAEALYGLAALLVRSAEQPRRLSLTAVSTLAALERSGPRRITELAALQGVTQPSMTTLAAALEQAGLVGRGPDPTDKRAVLVTLIPAGVDYLRERRRTGAAAVQSLIAQLDPADAAALAAAAPALERLRNLGG